MKVFTPKYGYRLIVIPEDNDNLEINHVFTGDIEIILRKNDDTFVLNVHPSSEHILPGDDDNATRKGFGVRWINKGRGTSATPVSESYFLETIEEKAT